MVDEMVDRSKTQTLTSQENRLCNNLKLIIKMDTMHIQATDKEYDVYLHLAVENYLECILLESPDEFTMSLIFRLFGLWISNQTDEKISHLVADKVNDIPAYKFVPLMPQITAHLGSSCTLLGDVIAHIVRKCQ